MGLGQSKEQNDERGGEQRSLGDLPQDCFVCILSHLRPRDVCRLALVSRAFMEASRADAVWEQMLPPRYQDALAQAYGGPLQFSSKRELYDRLCQQILLKDGTEGYWLDRANGEACYMLSARALRIVWGSDPRYWEWHPRHGSRFHEVAYLRDVCWFEVSGSLSCHMPPTTYTVSFRLQLGGEPYVVPQAHGWGYAPVNFSLSTTDGQQSQSRRYLDGAEVPERNQLELLNLTSVRMVDDHWMEYDVGEFIVRSVDELVEVQFSMLEIERGHWKSGLFLDGVVIRPSHLVPHRVQETRIIA